MRHSTTQNAGDDISKDTLDVCLHPSGAAKRVTNDGKGHRALIAWLAPSEIVRIVFERRPARKGRRANPPEMRANGRRSANSAA